MDRTIKVVSFSWESLIHSDDHKDKDTFVFPDRIKSFFKILKQMGIRIHLYSDTMSKEKIKEYLVEMEVSNYVENVSCCSRSDKMYGITNLKLLPYQVCIVDKGDVCEAVKILKEELEREKKERTFGALGDEENENEVSSQTDGSEYNFIRVTSNEAKHLDQARDLIYSLHFTNALEIYRIKRPQPLFACFPNANLGNVRAANFTYLLRHHTGSPLFNLIVMYSLLCSTNGNLLKSTVCDAMGFKDATSNKVTSKNLEAAKNYFLEEITEFVKRSFPESDVDKAVNVAKDIAQHIVTVTDTNKSINFSQANEIANMISRLVDNTNEFRHRSYGTI